MPESSNIHRLSFARKAKPKATGKRLSLKERNRIALKERHALDREYSRVMEPRKPAAVEIVKPERTIKASPVKIIAATGEETIVPAIERREWIPPRLREAVLHRDNGLCRYCKSKAKTMHIDHVYPFSLGGLTNYDNLVLACARCNLAKGIKLWKPIPLDQMRL